MKLPFARPSAAFPLLLCVASSAPLTLLAQNNGIVKPIASPKVLVIAREFTKPGKDGSPHEKTEGGFVHAMEMYKGSPRYIAMTSLSGQNRALFFSYYPSFAAWEAEQKSVAANATLSAALDRANVADGDLLSETNSSVWMQREDLSLNAGYRVGSRLFEIGQYFVRPGHVKEWEDLVKLVIDGYKKGVPDAHWAIYEQAYGPSGNAYLVLISLKSGAEVDANFASGKKFAEAMGEDGMKKMDELEASCLVSFQTNLFLLNPKMSYAPDALVQAEPDFWTPKVAAAPKPATAPAKPPAAQ